MKITKKGQEEERDDEKIMKATIIKNKISQGCCGAVEQCVLWALKGLKVDGFESCPRSECRVGFLTWGNSFLAGGL
ncbi:hypothetical protein E2C01_028056 [Portunus trituberculatus]|uniref:Uncharacterized protein n=1 Tax=Portunus trituberculatus TaxID=210409 RepID=A0A5B7EJP3_PORTR|nr:hypothetical protein [Portunus trituberculatus]